MAKLTINGKTVTVDDKFLQLSPEEQDATVEEIAQSMGAQAAQQPQPPEQAATPEQGYWGTANTALDTMLAGLPTKLNAGISSAVEGTASGLMGNGFDYSTPYNKSLEFQRGSQNQFEEQNPGKAMLGKGVGVAGVAMLPGIGQGVKGAIGTGALYGGLTGALQDSNTVSGHASNTAVGALTGGAVGGLLGAAGQALYSLLGRGPKAPSLLDLENVKNAKYKAVDAAGEAYTPEQMQTLASGISDDLAAAGVDPILDPMPYRFQQVIQNKAQAPVTLRELDKIDSKIGRKLLASSEGEDRYLGGLLRDNISEFMDANGGSGLVNEARAAHKRYRNLERVLDKTEKATRRASSTGSGGNEDNAIRQNIRSILDNPKTAKFYSAEEKAAMEKVVSGTTPQNIARRVGKMSPENGGLMAALATIGSALNPVVGIPAATGFVSKRVADAATKKNLNELIYLLSTGTQKPSKAMTPAQKKALENMVRAGTVGLLGMAAQ